MRYTYLLALGALAAPASLAAAQTNGGAQTPRALMAAALEAIGGEAAARDLAVMDVEGVQVAFALGQELTPGGAPPTTGRRFSVVYDWAKDRSTQRIEGQAGAKPFVLRQFVARDAALFHFNGAIAPLAAVPTAALRRGLRTVPHRLLLAALAPGSALTALAPRTWEERRQTGVRVVTATDTVGLWFDVARGELAGYETWSDDPVLGDRTTYVAFDVWTALDGHKLRLPAETRVYVNGRISLAQTLLRLDGRAAAPDSLFAVPDSLRGRSTLATTGPAVTVRLVELAPSVWQVMGGTHHSLAVVQGDSTILLDAPFGHAWMRAVLDTLTSRVPAAPVRLAVNTHHHWDHASGVRTVLGAGIPVLTHANNVAFLRQIGRTPKTVAPDRVEWQAQGHVIRGMRDSLAIGQGERQVIVYEVPNRHAEGMLLGYLPAPRILFVADLQGQPDQGALLDFIRARRLNVDRVVGTHAPARAFADFERAVLATR